MNPEVMKGNFWALSGEQACSELESTPAGLSEQEARARIERFGPNSLKKKPLRALRIFLRQFKSPLLWILIVTAVLISFWGQTINTIIILSMVVLSSFLSFYNEYTSEKIVENLNKKIGYKTIVLRNGEKQEVLASEVVPGDIVYLALGSVVPADIRILEAKDLEANESVLTGESNPVRKKTETLQDGELKITEMSNIVFTGTTIVMGEGFGIVVHTGESTEYGKIAQATKEERPETEFQKGINKFGGLLVKIILYLTLAIFAVNALLKHDLLESLLFALAIAIGLTPELLPAIITVSLSKGAHAMAKKDVIVKRLVAIEDFGNMDVLCTDKTGTLTEGTLTLNSYETIDGKTDERIPLYGAICSENIVHGHRVSGNPLDVALYRQAHHLFKDKMEKFRKLGKIPFDYERKRMSVFVKDEFDKEILITKGAPHKIIGQCSKAYIKGRAGNIGLYKKTIEEKAFNLANEGFRVIAVAYKECKNKDSFSIDDEAGLTFLGFIIFRDPPKSGVRASIDHLEGLNIKFKILTGDNEIVTKKIAEQVDIPISKVILADEIDRMSDSELSKAVEEANAFCRLSPAQKARIIKALRQNGHEVGFMGDGVNDVPALHAADVGISVNDAVDVAKDASDIILLKKSIESLVEGVMEGRKIFSNTLKYLFIGTSSNFGNMFSAAGASAFLPFLPMLPVQILLVNLLYDTSQISIPTDNVDPEALKKPKKLNVKLIEKYMYIFGPISSLYDFITYGVMFFLFKASESLFQSGWFIESMMTELFVVFVIRTRRFPFFKSKPSKLLLFSVISIALVTITIPFSPVAPIFGLTPLPAIYFAFLIFAVLTYLLIVEIVKHWFFKKYDL